MSQGIEKVEARQALPNKSNFRVLYYSLALCGCIALIGLLVVSF